MGQSQDQGHRGRDHVDWCSSEIVNQHNEYQKKILWISFKKVLLQCCNLFDILILGFVFGLHLHRNAENSSPHFQSLPLLIPALTSRWSSSHPLQPQISRAEAKQRKPAAEPVQLPFFCQFNRTCNRNSANAKHKRLKQIHR